MTTLYLIYILYSLKTGLGVYWYEWFIFFFIFLLNPLWDLAKITYIKNLNFEDAKSHGKVKSKKNSPLGKIT